MSPISDKTRKILWGRSGNRCAICKHELIVDATEKDSEAIVGEECHIISPEPNGPRHDPSYPIDKLDSYENLILLCRVHHKMVDDQETTYTANILHQMKNNHEELISEKLSDKQKIKPVRFRRIKGKAPIFLYRITTGKQLFEIVSGAHAFSMDYDELNSQDEVDLIGGFFQEVSDLDIGNELEPGERINYAYNLTQLINELEEKEFYVFGDREQQLIEGGIINEPSNWYIAHVRVVRKNNKEIIHFSTGGAEVQLPPTPANASAFKQAEKEKKNDTDQPDLGI